MEEQAPAELIAAAQTYENLFVPTLFAPWVQTVIAAADIKPAARVLDVACGTGVVARTARRTVGEDGRVFGVDLAPGMLAVARDMEPNVEWRIGNVEALAFDSASFDNVVCQFGMMFFQDRARAAAEMLRVLKPGGSIAVAVWDSVDKNPPYADIIDLLEAILGTPAADALRLPYSLGDTGQTSGALTEAGFERIGVMTETRTFTLPRAHTLVEADLRGWLPLFDIFLDDAQVDAVLTAAEHRLAKYVDASGQASYTMSAHIVHALRPSQ